MTENSEVQPTVHVVCRLENLDRRTARFVSEETDTIVSQSSYKPQEKQVPTVVVNLTREEFERRGRPNIVRVHTD